MEPLVSIITVVYNGVTTIEQTIQSVLQQTYSNIEYIIIDGGSTDGTLDIIEKYKEKIAYRVSEPDKGLYDAMNKGIAKANGELIGMINSDDWYEHNAVQLIVSTYKLNPAKRIFHGDRFDILSNGNKRLKPFNSSRLKFIYYGMTYNHPSMFVHRDIYKTLKYNVNLRSSSDYEFVLKLFLKHFEIFQYIPVAYVNYRLEGISNRMSIKQALKEGYKARQNAGVSLWHNLISVIIRLTRVSLRF